MQTLKFDTDHATIWFAFEDIKDVIYHYGGTRLVDPETSDQIAMAVLSNLASTESGFKNRLINTALASLNFPEFPQMKTQKLEVAGVLFVLKVMRYQIFCLILKILCLRNMQDMFLSL